MRIAVVSLHTSPAAQPGQGDAGGLNVYARATVRTLLDAGHEVQIFTADPAAGRTGPDVHSAVRDEIAGARGVAPVHLLDTGARGKDDLMDHREELVSWLTESPEFRTAQLIWTHYWMSADVVLDALSRLREGADRMDPQVRLVVSFHTVGAVKDRDTGSHSEPAQRLAAERRAAQSADLAVANTQLEHDAIVELLGAAPDRVCVASPGVDHSVFHPAQSGPAAAGAALDGGPRGAAPGEIRLLYVGRMQHVKGTDVAIAALGEIHSEDPELPIRLVMLGAGSGGQTSAEYLAEARRLGVADRLEILPPVPPEQLAEHYRSASIVLVPSRSESFGFAAAEAAACGAAVVGSAVGGLPEILDRGAAGILVRPGDAHGFAQAILNILANPRLRDSLKARAVQSAQRFTWHANVRTVLDELERVGSRR